MTLIAQVVCCMLYAVLYAVYVGISYVQSVLIFDALVCTETHAKIQRALLAYIQIAKSIRLACVPCSIHA